MNHGHSHRPRSRESRSPSQLQQPTLRHIDPTQSYVKHILEQGGADHLDGPQLRPIQDALRAGRPVALVAQGLISSRELRRLEYLQAVEA